MFLRFQKRMGGPVQLVEAAPATQKRGRIIKRKLPQRKED